MSKSDNQFLDEFQSLIGLIMHRTMNNLMQFTKSRGISMTQMGALRHIHYRGSCNISDISGEMGITNPASSQLLDRLVQLELITRHENPHDRRNKQLVMTEKGRQFLLDTLPTRQPWLTDLAASLSAEEKAQVIDAFHLLSERVGKLDEKQAVESPATPKDN